MAGYHRPMHPKDPEGKNRDATTFLAGLLISKTSRRVAKADKVAIRHERALIRKDALAWSKMSKSQRAAIKKAQRKQRDLIRRRGGENQNGNAPPHYYFF